ncbi:MAG: hypothetical protein IKA77_04430 [Clostridia bacterium]|nr:hypothetical protein [Clostridia bacterium]
MFGKKKREAEARAQAEAAAKAKKKVRTASWQKVSNGPVPVARPADYIQLTPIVQPIPLVPYSSQLQPLAMYEDGLEEDYE